MFSKSNNSNLELIQYELGEVITELKERIEILDSYIAEELNSDFYSFEFKEMLDLIVDINKIYYKLEEV